MKFIFVFIITQLILYTKAHSTIPTSRIPIYTTCSLIPKNFGKFKLFDDGFTASLTKTLNNTKKNIKNFINVHEHSAIGKILSPLFKLPPITLSYLTLSTILSASTQLYSDNYDIPPFLKFDAEKICNQFQLWRLATPYLYFGPLFLPHLYMCHYISTYMSSLETTHKLEPAKFAEFLLFGITSLSGIALLHDTAAKAIFNYYISKNLKNQDYLRHLAGYEHRKRQHTFSNLSYYLTNYMLYYWSRLNEGSYVNLYNLFTVKAEYVPFVFMLQNYLIYKEISPYEPIAIGLGYLYFSALAKRPPLKVLTKIIPNRKDININ